MILYFSATGNSLAIARQLAERLNERLMLLTEAVKQDLTGEKRIGLVFPTYDFNLPPAMPEMVARLKISPQSYVFTVVTCGSMAGNCVWVLRRLLRKKGAGSYGADHPRTAERKPHAALQLVRSAVMATRPSGSGERNDSLPGSESECRQM